MSEVTLTVPNAILFVFDIANLAVEVPEYFHGRVTSSTASYVSIVTRAAVDGEVTLRLEKGPLPACDPRCETVREHSIITPSHKVAVVTSNFERILETAVEGTKAQLMIAVDDPRAPTLISIEVC
jgi:hypothetical protein